MRPTTHHDDHGDDHRFMGMALDLARRGLGNVWPNPAVGCVVVRDGRHVVGRGWTQPGGRPHAETEALKRAGGLALGATAYVTLEPCSIYGHTPPCTMALLHAGVRRVVAAAVDPDPRVDGRGIEQLRQAGVRVDFGLRRAEAEALNAGFFKRLRVGLPLVTLKLATSLDGRIATRTGASRWITGPAARARGHHLRATHDAIMIGSGTALADDPELTCRLPGMADRSPVRVVLDGRLRLSAEAKLVRTATAAPTWLVTAADIPEQRRAPLERAGVTLIEVPTASGGGLSLPEALGALARRGITRLLVEGGGTLAAALLRARLVDRVVWFHAPLVIGGDGLAAVAGFGVESLAEAAGLRRIGSEELEDDTATTYIPAGDGED
jgi:diaminohydroxyphosphoribosylaminopyrimidine deaminase / 5-amino-6-(5-phosphoribosylamino)uracil reductase